jgi:ATP-dependent Clp protease, protease subunit
VKFQLEGADFNEAKFFSSRVGKYIVYYHFSYIHNLSADSVRVVVRYVTVIEKFKTCPLKLSLSNRTHLTFPLSIHCLAPSFVPRTHGVVSPMPKIVVASQVYGHANRQMSSGAASVTMMPIGVPKVAYRVPGSQQADWVDIYNRLYRERIIFLGSEIDDELANQVIGVMLYLDSEDSSKPIYLYINCPGGSVISGLAIFDCMQHIKSEVITINLGLAASMASFILAAGSKGKRLALPSSRIMIHQPMGGAQGQAEDIKVEAAQIMRIRDNLVKMYSMMTGQTQDTIIKDLDRDNFLSAYEAQEYGLVDRVLEYNKETDSQL